MSLFRRVRRWPAQSLEWLRLQLSLPDALLQLAALGILTGLASGTVILAFRLLIESSQAAFLPGGLIERFERLEPQWRVILPVSGGLAAGLLLQWLARGRHVVGVVHVMERLAYHQGHLPARPFLLQFVTGAIALISGQSVGREGPSIHLGAAAGSLLGQRLQLPNNTIRTLVGCGSAAAIAASFNTPLAGVIFALEVVMMEYTVASFTPVILAAVSATWLSINVYGPEPAFNIPAHTVRSLWEIPLIVTLGLVAGAIAAAFITLTTQIATHSRTQPIWVRTTLAGVVTGLCALLFPQVMGIGYDTVNSALLGELGLGLLVGIVAFKLVATAAAVGLGVPGGLIGPTFVMGATLGGFAGTLYAVAFPDLANHSGFYALLGMGALMGATLQAPLAALTAMIELTGSPKIILPGMLAVITAGLASSELFGKHSVFLLLLKARGLDYRSDPVMLALRRVGVAGIMDRSFQRLDAQTDRASAEEVLRQKPEWILIDTQAGPELLMPAVDLARHLQEEDALTTLDLREIPARRLQVTAINLQANLQEALDQLTKARAEALYVERPTAPGIHKIYGVLTRERIESAYRY